MRGTAVGLLLVAAAAMAQNPTEGALSPDKIALIEALVEDLGARDPLRRLEAQRQLGTFGRRVVPILRAMDPDEPEARVRIRAVLTWFEAVLLEARLGASHVAAGQPVALSMTLTNYTRETYLLPISIDRRTPFSISIGGKMRRLKRSELAFFPHVGSKQFVTLPPGQSLTVRVAIGPDDLPKSEGTSFSIVARYVTRNSLLLRGNPKNTGQMVGDPGPLSLSSLAHTIDVRTHSIEELEAALGDPKRRAGALLEVRFRSDRKMLPLLRRHAHEEDLRLHVIKRLGREGDEQDLSMMRRATGDPDAQVRVAATLALGGFDHRKARQRLSLLARTDAELRGHAVTALAKHRHARTIDTFVAVLKHKYREGAWVKTIQASLKEWTGLTVRNSPGQVASFERWWIANRARWIREN